MLSSSAGKLGLLLGVAMLATLSFVPGPYASVMQTPNTASPSFQGSHLDPQTIAQLKLSCGNCHSNETTWPVYSKVAPVSWLVRNDVSEGRKYFNFSSWRDYGPDGESQLLAAAADQITSGKMPISRYTMIHPDARLTEPQRQQLAAALTSESQRLANISKPKP